MTAGETDECPVLDELRALAEGHPDDCVLIDDARLFVEPPPPPHKPDQWPSLDEVVVAIRATRPAHQVEVHHDIIVAVPPSAEDLVERFGDTRPERASLIRRALSRALER